MKTLGILELKNNLVFLLRGPTPGWKPMCDCSGLIIAHYKGPTWQVSQRKAALPIPDWVHSQGIAVFEGTCSQGPRLPWLVMLLCLSAFLVQASLFLGFFIWGLGLRASSGASAKASLSGKGANLEDIFPLSQYSIFPPSHLGSAKIPQSFVQGSVNSETTPHHSDLGPLCILWEKMDQGELALFLVLASYITSVSG